MKCAFIIYMDIFSKDTRSLVPSVLASSVLRCYNSASSFAVCLPCKKCSCYVAEISVSQAHTLMLSGKCKLCEDVQCLRSRSFVLYLITLNDIILWYYVMLYITKELH